MQDSLAKNSVESSVWAACLGFALLGLSGGAAQAQVVTEFSAGITAGAKPAQITAGPDGNLWFTEESGGIGRITPLGVVTEFTAGITAGANPQGITAGPDGNLWFAEDTGSRIGRITTSGVITEFSAGITAGADPFGITVGPDGNLWFAEQADRIGRITPAGVVTEFSAGITAGANPRRITVGPDGNLWFTEGTGNRIGRITPAGVVTEFSAGITAGARPEGIKSGLDGNLWFAETGGNRIGRITPAGVVTEFSAGITAGAGLTGITTGPDGNLWFTERLGNRIGRITPAGVVTEFSAGITPGADTRSITAGPDGNLWFAETGGNRIGRITTGAPCNIDGTTLCLSEDRFKVQAHWSTPDGQSGSGQAVQLTSDTGYFWFFGSSNVEMVIKVLNACGVNQRFWVFAGGLTNVQVDLTVTDTVTFSVKTYQNPQNTAFLPIQDTSAFATCLIANFSDERADTSAKIKGSPAAEVPVSKRADLFLACTQDPTTLCLGNGRFKVQAHWTAPDSRTGDGAAIPLSGDTGYFWFFSPTNVEMIVKVLDGCAINSKKWVFAGGLTDVNVVVTVTDMQTGGVRTYTNPQSTAFQPIQDTSAFATCP